MKKYMIAAAAMLAMTGAVNAQVAKQPGKNSNAIHTAKTTKPVANHQMLATNTQTGKTKMAKADGKSDEMGIKRKHHKKTMSPKKTPVK